MGGEPLDLNTEFQDWVTAELDAVYVRALNAGIEKWLGIPRGIESTRERLQGILNQPGITVATPVLIGQPWTIRGGVWAQR
jgi:hypothetical protein